MTIYVTSEYEERFCNVIYFGQKPMNWDVVLKAVAKT